MFTAAEYRLIREDCPKKLDSLLENLKIEKPTWNEGEEFEIYAKLDDEIISKLCEKMDSESIIDGYTKLMKLGDLHFDYSETHIKKFLPCHLKVSVKSLTTAKLKLNFHALILKSVFQCPKKN